MVADLFDARGVMLQEARSILSMRALQAGTYFLKVYNPDPTQSGDLPFEISIRAPIAGVTHESDTQPDRDVIDGGEGADILIGNDDVDRLRGGSGVDSFVGEAIEIRDLSLQEKENKEPTAVPVAEASDRSRLQPDPIVVFDDPALLGAVARQLGLPLTESYLGEPLTHEPIFASDMVVLQRLELSGLGIESLVGLEFATNLISLSLSNNDVTDLLPIVPQRADSGEVVGALNLDSLSLDFNAGITDVRPGIIDENGDPIPSPIEGIGELTTLRHLSLDGNPILDPSPFFGIDGGRVGIAELTGLEFLSIDSTTSTQPSSVTITEDGLLTEIFEFNRGLGSIAAVGFDSLTLADANIKRTDSQVFQANGSGPFEPGRQSDRFAARWTGSINVTARTPPISMSPSSSAATTAAVSPSTRTATASSTSFSTMTVCTHSSRE